MFGALKRLFSKLGNPAKDAATAPVRPATPTRVTSSGSAAPAWAPSKPASGESGRSSGSSQTSTFRRVQPAPAQKPSAPQPGTVAPAAPAVPAVAAAPVAAPATPAPVIPRAVVRLPLEPILSRMPTTLIALLQRPDAREIAVPLQIITAQLNTGAIRVPFGEFRKFAAEGTFADNPIHDQIVIELPLREVLERIGSQLLVRRPQRKVAVPDSVTSVFGPTSPVGPQPPAVPQRTPEMQTSTFRRAPVDHAPSAPAPAVAPTVPSVPSVPSLTVVVSAVSADWPKAIRAEIDKFSLQQSALVLPLNRLEPALKSGRAAFPWAELAGWLKPGFPIGFAPDPAVWVDLPLSVIAPLFMALVAGTARPRKKVAVVENLPDLFSGNAEAPSTVPTPANSMPASLADLVPQPIPFVPKPMIVTDQRTDSIAEILSGLYKPDWSPFDLVNRTAVLIGAVGALLATRDGLLVADKLPSHLNPETMSAFLPQMFSRMNQYSTELQLGPLSSMSLMMGTAPCMILEAGSLYLIVLGRAGEQLPASQIQQIAAELAKRNP